MDTPASTDPAAVQVLSLGLAAYEAAFAAMVASRLSPATCRQADEAFRVLRQDQRARWPSASPDVDHLGLLANDAIDACEKSGVRSSSARECIAAHTRAVELLRLHWPQG